MKSKRKSKKQMKMLGTDLEGLLDTCLSPARPDSRHPTGTLGGDEWNMFWEQATDKRAATVYLTRILTQLAEAFSAGKKRAEVPVAPAALANTVQMLAMFLPYNPDKRIDKAVAQWHKKDQKHSSASSSSAAAAAGANTATSLQLTGAQVSLVSRDAIRTLETLMSGESIVSMAIVAASTLHTQEEFRKLGDVVEFVTCRDSDVQAAQGAFLFPYLMQLCESDPSLRATIYQQTVHKLLTVQKSQMLNPKVGQTTLLSLLHMLIQFAAISPIADSTLLASTAKTVQRFLLWPKPFCINARDVMLAFQADIVSPGTNWRKRLDRAARALPVKGMDDEYGQSARAVYYLVPPGDAQVEAWIKMLQLAPLDDEPCQPRGGKFRQPGLSPTTQLLASMSILQTADTDRPLEKDELQLLSGSMFPEGAAALYEELKRIADQPIDPRRPPMEQRLERAAQIADVRARLSEFADVKGHDGSATLRLSPAAMKLGSTTSARYFAPPLPPIAHIFVRTDPDPYDGPYLMLSRSQIRMMYSEEYTPYPSTPMVARLKELLEMHPGSEDNPVELRIVVTGGDRSLHQTVCAYTYLEQTEREHLLKGVRLMFLLVPWQSNRLASFIARHDSWYYRHIYSPFRTPGCIVPWLHVDQPEMDAINAQVTEERANAGNPSAPAPSRRGSDASGMADEADYGPPNPQTNLLRQLVESYVRDSSHTCDVNLYRIDGWKIAKKKRKKSRRSNSLHALKTGTAVFEEESDGPPPDESIPMCQRLEIGLVPDARDFQAKNNIPNTTKFADIVRDKRFTYMARQLEVSFTSIGLDGQKQAEVSEAPATYETILVTNVPAAGDGPLIFPANPESDYLEMVAVHTDDFKVRDGINKSVLLADPRQHVNEMVVKCAHAGADILVRVDGQLFGPYERIKLTPMTSRHTGERMTLPVQTFFEFDL